MQEDSVHIFDFELSDGPNGFQQRVFFAQKNNNRYGLKTPINSTLHYNTFHNEYDVNERDRVYWYLPIFQYISDLSYHSLEFKISANLQTKDISESVFCYSLAKGIALQFKGGPYHFRSSGMTGEELEELSYAVFKPFIYLKRPDDGSILMDIIVGVGAVGGAAYTIFTTYSQARAGALQIYSDVGRLTKVCAQALERARRFK